MKMSVKTKELGSVGGGVCPARPLDPPMSCDTRDTSKNESNAGADPGGPGPPPLTTKNEAPAPKFYKIEAPEWQF